MTFPAFLIGSLISVLIASIFHLIVDGNLGRYLSYIFFSWLGFWIGYYLSNQITFSIWRLGILDVGINTICSILVLALIYWIDKGSEENQESKEDK